MPTFQSIAEVEQYIKDAINSCMQSEMAEAIKEAEQEAIQQEVYDAYSPTQYKRRYGNGGLGSPSNMVAEPGDMSVSVYNRTRSNSSPQGANYPPPWHYPIELAQAISSGYTVYLKPSFAEIGVPARPFVPRTYEILEGENAAVDTLRAGLNARGIPTE